MTAKDHNYNLNVDLNHNLDQDLALDLENTLNLIFQRITDSEAPVCLIFTKFTEDLI